MNSPRKALVVLLSGLCSSLVAHGANWDECNGTPVSLKNQPTPFVFNGCSVKDDGSTAGSYAAINAMYEVRTYENFAAFGGVTPDSKCYITHNDGQSDIAYVRASEIDGNPGTTMKFKDGCTFSWDEEHIVESDVMVATELDFGEPDESFVATGMSAKGLGRLAVLHELGHGVGLQHTSEFGVMRVSVGSGLPTTGGSLSSGHALYTADDVYGLRRVHGIPSDFPNMYVSAQWLDKENGQNKVRNTDMNLAADAQLSNPDRLCPGDSVSMIATVGNQSQFSRQTTGRVYADIPGQCSALDGVGTELVRFNVTAFLYSTYSFAADFTIPASIPRDANLRVFTAINVGGSPWDEKRAYDDCARSALTIFVPNAGVCGR